MKRKQVGHDLKRDNYRGRKITYSAPEKSTAIKADEQTVVEVEVTNE